MATDIGDMEKHSDKVLALLKALSNQKRLMIICHLINQEKSVTQLQNSTGMEQSALSQHLAKLRHVNVVKTRRDARTIFYSLSDDKIDGLMQSLCNLYK